MVDLTYSAKKIRKKHRMRLIGPPKKGILGITFSKQLVSHLQGVWYTTQIQNNGKTIILQSGCSPETSQ